MRYAIIEDGRVVNVAEAEAPLEAGWVRGDAASIGDLYDGQAFSSPPPDVVALAAAARGARRGLLATCDWTQLFDAPVDREAWATYRQALRDIPSQPDFPLTVEWPTTPQ